MIGATPLHEAVRSDNVELIALLCTDRPPHPDSGHELWWAADVNAVDMNDDSPLHLAAAKGDRSVVGALLDRGANMGIRNKRGNTPYMLAAHYHHEGVSKDLRLRLYIRKYAHFLKMHDDLELHRAARKIQRTWTYWRTFRKQAGTHYANAVFQMQRLYWDVQEKEEDAEIQENEEAAGEAQILASPVRSCRAGCQPGRCAVM